jgi:hypothetical protein
MIEQDYGELGQSLVDEITDTLRGDFSAAALSYIAEQECFQVTGFSETQQGKCVQIISQVQSHAFRLEINEETDLDIIRFQLIPILSESDLARTAHEFSRFARDTIKEKHEFRSRRAIQIRFERLREEGQLSPRNL